MCITIAISVINWIWLLCLFGLSTDFDYYNVVVSLLRLLLLLLYNSDVSALNIQGVIYINMKSTSQLIGNISFQNEKRHHNWYATQTHKTLFFRFYIIGSLRLVVIIKKMFFFWGFSVFKFELVTELTLTLLLFYYLILIH